MTVRDGIATLPGNLLNFVSERDRRLMRRIHRWQAPRLVRVVMISASRAGDGWIWYGLGLLILLFGGSCKFVAFCAGSLAAGAGVGIYLVLKKATDRKRPCAIEPHCWARIRPPDRYSFPSGHTITAFSIAMAVGLFYPSLMPGLLFCALTIATSRIVLGMHFFSDVLAGTLIGGSLGCGAFYLLR
jgi:undecaprenyl-diphosphatase